MNFSFLDYQTRKVGPQIIMVKSSKVSLPLLLALLFIVPLLSHGRFFWQMIKYSNNMKLRLFIKCS